MIERSQVSAGLLIGDTALDRACARIEPSGSGVQNGSVDPVLAALRESNVRALERKPGSLPARSPSWNLFVIQTCLFELALSVYLERSEVCLQALTDLVVSLDPQGTTEERLPTEVHVAFVAVGLAVALELAQDSLDPAVLASGHETIERLALRLQAGAAREAWGQRAANRAAWNHSIVAFAGLGVAGLALPAHPSSPEWIASAIERSLLFFEHGITAAGMTREGLSYCGFVFRNLFPFLLGARASGAFDYRDPLQNPFLERLARVPAWYSGEVFPNGKWVQNINDSYWDSNPALAGFLPVFSELDEQRATQIWRRTVGERGLCSYGADDSLRWSTVFESMLWGPSEVASEQSRTEAPSEQSRTEGEFLHCRDVGYLRQWTADRSWGFSFNCGTFIGSIHDQSDNNSFTLFASGVPVVLDAGAANRAEEGSASSSHGHSAILIDGRGQAPSGGGLGVSGSLVRIERELTRTLVAGDATASYARDGYNPVLRAKRTCLFAHGANPYLLICDDIQKDEAEHEYEFLLHTPTPTSSVVEGQRVRMAIDFDGISAGAEILVLDPPGVRISSESFTSPGQPPFTQHTLWRIAAKAVNPRFVVLFTAADHDSIHV
ncbi:MAG TPA: heparinase II/III family protein [Solirubrobacteraceae bacterium]